MNEPTLEEALEAARTMVLLWWARGVLDVWYELSKFNQETRGLWSPFAAAGWRVAYTEETPFLVQIGDLRRHYLTDL